MPLAKMQLQTLKSRRWLSGSWGKKVEQKKFFQEYLKNCKFYQIFEKEICDIKKFETIICS